MLGLSGGVLKRVGILSNHPLSLPLVKECLGMGFDVGFGSCGEAGFLGGLLASGGVVGKLWGERVWEISGEGVENWVARLNPDVMFVFLFSKKIPDSVLSGVRGGFWNFHPAPLPGFRGADPVFWMIREGNESGGLCVHRMDAGWDTGPLWRFYEERIGAEDTHGSFLERLGRVAVVAVRDWLEAARFADGIDGLVTAPQARHSGRYWRRPQPEDWSIQWERQSAAEVVRVVRAANPYCGGARAGFGGESLQVFDAAVASAELPGIDLGGAGDKAFGDGGASPPGAVMGLLAEGPMVRCAGGSAVVLSVIGIAAGILSGSRWAALRNVRAGQLFDTL